MLDERKKMEKNYGGLVGSTKPIGETGRVANNVRCTIDAACFGQIL